MVVERHRLTNELAAARDDAANARATLAGLAHDLATPMGVVMGMTQLLELLEGFVRRAPQNSASDGINRNVPGAPTPV
jgi:signal transduction histidine kinase